MDINQITQHLCQRDKSLEAIITHSPPLTIETSQGVFNDLISCIIEQQIHYRSSKRTFAKMLEAADLEKVTPDNFSHFEEAGIRDYKLSGRKYETLLNILTYFETQQSIQWAKLSDQEIRAQLSQIKGVGPWTIDMILLYTLERPDVFPADDYHLKKIMQQLYEIDPAARIKAQLKSIAANWVPYRSYAVKYLLAWKEIQKNVTL